MGKCFDLLLLCIQDPFVSSLKTPLKKAEREECKDIIQQAGWKYKVGVHWEKFCSELRSYDNLKSHIKN